MANWWPIDTREAKGRTCDACGSHQGLSRDDQNRIFCKDHRDHHDD